MGNSLFDQLKKTGLVDKAKAQKIRQDRYKDKKKKGKKGSAEPVDEAKLLAEKAHAEKVERDREANKRQKLEAERKAVIAQIVQLIETNRIENRDGEIVYNFTDDNVVKRIHVSEQVHKHLTSGHLSVVRLRGGYDLVPRPVAEKIKQRDAHYVIDNEHNFEPDPADDDAYAEYKIPDDLMW